MEIKSFIFSLFLIFFTVPCYSDDYQKCVDCHDSLQTYQKRKFQHLPFKEGLCEECHALKNDNTLSSTDKSVDWLEEGAISSTYHAFRISDDKLGEILVVETKGSLSSFNKEEILIPLLSRLRHLEDSKITPKILNPRLIGLEQGIFLTATVAWETNTLTDAAVEYGEDDILMKVPTNRRFGRKHQVILRNLAPNTNYRFVAISTDLFGRKVLSEPVTFSSKISASQSQPGARDVLDPVKELTINFSRVENDFLIEVLLPQASEVFIGSKGRKSPCLPVDDFHTELSCVEIGLMTACLNCHDRHAHPVGIKPKKKETRIPADFPTLPGGQIACASCHNPHSSQHSQLTRKNKETSLCVSCHSGLSK